MKRRDPLLRAASRLAEVLSSSAPASAATSAHSHNLAALLDCFAAIQRTRRLQAFAHARGWLLVAHKLSPELIGNIRQAESFARSLSRVEQLPSQPPCPRNLLEDLRQLKDEFEEVEFDLKNKRIVARTPPIELEGVALGPFAIELHWCRLSQRCPDASCFVCVALRPNPASSNNSITHPHVQDHHLCAGEAAAPISAALRQGRICDAFCLVRSVLQTYNSASPYVSLEEWDGTACGDCGHTTSPQHLSRCEHCDGDFCDECMSYCDACDGSSCRGCLQRDPETDNDLCPSCRAECSHCGRVVGKDDLDGQTELCPQCLEEKTKDVEQEQEDPETQDPKENANDAEHTQPVPSESPATAREPEQRPRRPRRSAVSPA